MITLRYALTEEDFVNYTVFVQWEAPGKKKNYFQRSFLILIVVVVISVINLTNRATSDTTNFIDFFPYLFFAVVILLPFFTVKPRLKKQALLFAKNPENVNIFDITDHTFSETGVIITDSTKETKFQWNAFVKKQENASYIFLFIQSNGALIIPKAVIRSEVEKEQLMKLLSQHISFDAEVGHLVKT